MNHGYGWVAGPLLECEVALAITDAIYEAVSHPLEGVLRWCSAVSEMQAIA